MQPSHTVDRLGVVFDEQRLMADAGLLLRSFQWGHVRQLDAVSRQLLTRAWANGEAPERSPPPTSPLAATRSARAPSSS